MIDRTELDFIRESNAIEPDIGDRDPTEAEIKQFIHFQTLSEITIPDLQDFVNVYAPGAKLRDHRGMNIYICNSRLCGGPEVVIDLQNLLDRINNNKLTPWEAHVEYELLHPFMDGNGRSGRPLWYWHMEQIGTSLHKRYGFLHAWYYQTLQYKRKEIENDCNK